MKFLILGDLHGAMPKIHFKEFDAIICTGDFCSFEARKTLFKMPKEKWGTPWFEIVGKRKAKEMMKRDIKRGRKALEKLNKLNVPVFVVPGNTDYYGKRNSRSFFLKSHYDEMLKGLENIRDCHLKLWKSEELSIIGYGLSSSPDYPLYAKKPYGKEEKKRIREADGFFKRLSSAFRKAKVPVIFLSHNVPYNTKLDKIINKHSPMNGRHFGSLVTRKIIEKYNPLICIAGHMHEHFGKDAIGKTVVVNAGFGADKNVLLEIEGGKVKRIKFHK